jgi:cysteine desulfuration protein SufE
MHEGVKDLPIENVLKIPNDFYLEMGLQDVITGQRLNGLTAILAHMKKLATNHL